jgi:hypothetical protein
MMGLGRRLRRHGKVKVAANRSGRASRAQESWLRRQARGLRPDRNPLRRGTDRVEAYLLAGLFVAAAAGAPLAAQAASRVAYTGALRVQQEQLATRHQVTARLTEAAGSTVNGYTLSPEIPAKAIWTSVTGVTRTGEILAAAGSAKGTPITVWTDPGGYLVTPPMTDAQVAGQGDAAAIGAVAGVVVVFLTGARVSRYVFYRRRMAAWEADWTLTAPTWNRQSW